MERPLRICMVVTFDLTEVGGVKRHAMHLADSMRRDGHEVWVIGPSRGGDHGPYVHGFGGVVNWPSNGSDNHIGLLTPPWQVRRFFREHAFDVVHTHEPMVPTLPWLALAAARRPVHVCTFHAFAESEPLQTRAVRDVLGRLLARHYARGIAVSEPAERYARACWDKPLTIIPNGVPTEIFTPPDDDAGDAGRPLRGLFVGHWRDPRKGLPYLLEAHEQLRQRGIPVELDVVGRGNQAPPERPGVTFHGAITDERHLADLYRRADFFVAPATGQESFGIVLLEAMACARPVVASDIEGFRQVVSDDGAAFVPRGDAGALADAIAALATDPARRRSMGAANRRRAEEFDWDRLARRVVGVYRDALGGA